MESPREDNQHSTPELTAGMASAVIGEDLDPSEMKDKDTEKEQKNMDRTAGGSKTKEAKDRENKKRERSPKSQESGDKPATSPQKSTGWIFSYLTVILER